LAHEAGDIEGVGEDVAEVVGLSAVGQAVPGRAFEVAAGLIGVAAFGIALAALAQGPSWGSDAEVSGEADVAV